jgi:hypothetical protein
LDEEGEGDEAELQGFSLELGVTGNSEVSQRPELGFRVDGENVGEKKKWVPRVASGDGLLLIACRRRRRGSWRTADRRTAFPVPPSCLPGER